MITLLTHVGRNGCDAVLATYADGTELLAELGGTEQGWVVYGRYDDHGEARRIQVDLQQLIDQGVGNGH